MNMGHIRSYYNYSEQEKNLVESISLFSVVGFGKFFSANQSMIENSSFALSK